MEDCYLNLINSAYRPNLMMMFHLQYPEVLAKIPPTYIGDVPSVEPPKKKNKEDLTIILDSYNKDEVAKSPISVLSPEKNSDTSAVSSHPEKPSMPELTPSPEPEPKTIAQVRPPKKGPLEFMIVGSTPINLKNNGCFKCKQRFTSFANLKYHLTTVHQENLELLRLQIHALKRKRDEKLQKIETKKFSCVYTGCNKEFYKWKALIEHSSTHKQIN